MNGPPPDSPDAWLQSARSDLAAARSLLGVEAVFPEVPAYHAQQAAEKSLKAVLILLQAPFPRTHVIRALLDLVTLAGLEVPASVNGAFALTQFATLTRYPSVVEPVTSEEAEEAVSAAAAVLDWAEELLTKL